MRRFVVAVILVICAGFVVGCAKDETEPVKQDAAEKPGKVEEPKPRVKVYPKPPEGAVLIDTPATLDKENAVYFLTKDVTADGTAFTIVEDNVTLDLGGRTVVYNAKPSETPVHAVVTKKGKHKRRLGAGVYHITVQRGAILQGKGATKGSHALDLGGQFCIGYYVQNLEIRVHGVECRGISGSLNRSVVCGNYVESHATTDRIDGGGCDAMRFSASLGGLAVITNTIVGGHRGITLGSIATYDGTYLEKLGGHRMTTVHHNLIQHRRLEKGNKAPYGIATFRAHGVQINHNQIVSDNGRGIILDSNSTGIEVFNNLIDVQYSSTVSKGAYIENRVYGIRDRYGSGKNQITDNRIFVTNGVKGYIAGIYIGSDKKDPKMDGIEVMENIIHAHGGSGAWLGPGSTGIVLDWVDNIKVEKNAITSDCCAIINRHAEDGVTINANRLLRARGAEEWTGILNENKLTFAGKNTEADAPIDTEPPFEPEGLRIAKCLGAYILQWRPNTEDDDLRGYIVYRDGQELPISPRGGTFYIDLGLREGRHAKYALKAVDLSGNRSKRSANVSTKTAQLGWW